MKYQSTRSTFTTDSLKAVLQGPAPDGGLFIDAQTDEKTYPWQEWIKLDTISMAKKILSTVLPDIEGMEDLVEKAYRGRFETDNLTPLTEVGDFHVLELFRGPTSAFKDVALSILPHLMTQALKQSKSKDNILILTATSGDTGKAALEGFHDVDKIKIMVFYPDGGVSLVQKTQMTTQSGNNVQVCAVKGNFDDCQSAVKRAFANLTSKAKEHGFVLSSANSINIGRLAPQTVYYFCAYRDLVNSGKIKTGDKVDFCVPTGNFGDIFAGYWAKQMGLPVGKLICASNKNNILTDFFTTGTYNINREFYKTTSPSMDILISSNLERLLFLGFDKDTEKVKSCMDELSRSGSYQIPQEVLNKLQQDFCASYCSEEDSQRAIKEVWENHKYLMDPHTSVAWHCAQTTEHENPVVVLSTASPYKFPHSVLSALGEELCENEFELMKKLHSISGVPVPQNLLKLESLTPRFNDSIGINDISKYVEDFICK